jgi:cholera toxin transcriptional activator
MSGEARRFRFGTFELDVASGELRKDGKSWPRLRDQALQVLVMLLEKPDEVVTREELRARLWPADTFVDFDHSVNTAVNQVRAALGDSAANPRFIQTLPRRGYRFIAPVQILGGGTSAPRASEVQSSSVDDASAVGSVRTTILSEGEDLPAVRSGAANLLFALIQVMYLTFYLVALSRVGRVDEVLDQFSSHGIWLLVVLVVTAAMGIPVRCYLLTAVLFSYQGLAGKFKKLFPFVLVVDEIWAFAPFLLIHQIGAGWAIACTAALLYVPFSQRSLLLMAKR